MKLEERMQNNHKLNLLVAKLIDAACEVYECHCDPHPGEDDVLVERAGLVRLGLALKALDAHYAKGNK